MKGCNFEKMSVVTVQLGQCGIQVGRELFDVLYNDAHEGQRKNYNTASCERFFHQTTNGELVARAVLIDMEPKVINNSMTAKSDRWRYGGKSYFCQKEGSGNNWANGFCVHGPRHKEVVEELVRREVEQCDRLSGLMTMMSVAGGTGSGVGTYVTQCLRDIFPKSFILNHVTWPFSSGDVIVQNYNSVMTLGNLYRLSDAIFVHENDTVYKICCQLLNREHVNFYDINRVIAHQLGSVLQPVLTADSNGTYSRNPLGELVSSLACHPEFKLLNIYTIPLIPCSSIAYTTFSWPVLLKHLRQMLISNTKMEEGVDWQVRPPSSDRALRPTTCNFNTSLASLLILRGKDVYSAETGGFEEPALYTSWLPSNEAFNAWKSPVPFNKYEKSATLVSNSQSLLQPLDNMVKTAWKMFAKRAYVHLYIKYGITEEDFLNGFTSLEQVISSYRHLS